MSTFRVVHLSDLHFSKLSFNPKQFFSKRWLGNLNLLFSRFKDFETESLFSLVALFKEIKVDHVVITGDLSCTSLEEEFAQGLQFAQALHNEGIEVFALPGNHDHYTKNAFREKRFYDYFPSSLKEKGVSKKMLSKGWWLVALDTALATSLISSQGHFTEEIEKALFALLSEIPKSDKIILANHFPLFQNDGKRKALLRSQELKNLIGQFPNIVFYLHGHNHRQCIADLRPSGLPIILDSGSASQKDTGTWNLLEISPKECQIQVFQQAKPIKQSAFTL